MNNLPRFELHCRILRTPPLKRLGIGLLVLFLALCSAACQPKAAGPTTNVQPTDPPAAAASPAPTDTPLPEPTAPKASLPPACFTTSAIPFGFTPDNRYVLLRDTAAILAFDLQSMNIGEFLSLQLPAGQSIVVAALSPSGDRLAVALADNSIQIYAAAEKKLLQTLSGHTNIITELEFSPDGENLYSASLDQWVRVWDAAGKETGAFQPTGADDLPQDVLGLGISPDGSLLASVPFDGKTKIWDADTFALVRELSASGGYDTSDAVFSPDGQYLAATTANGLFLWRVADGAQLLGGNPGINAMAFDFSSDGLAYWDIQGEAVITFLSADGAQKLGSLPTGAAQLWTLLFSPDGTMLVGISDLGTSIWQTVGGTLLAEGKPECP